MKYKKTALVISSSVSVISVLMLGQGATVRFMHTFMAEVGFVLLLLSSVVTWCVAGANSRKDIVQLFEAERGQTRFWKERADSLQDSLDFYRTGGQNMTSAATPYRFNIALHSDHAMSIISTGTTNHPVGMLREYSYYHIPAAVWGQIGIWLRSDEKRFHSTWSATKSNLSSITLSR